MKNKLTILKCSPFALVLIMFVSCTETISIKNESEFESILIIEATITNEQKHQEILLSRTFKLEDDGPMPELGAIVFLKDSNGNSTEFTEESEGVYKSITEFKAQPSIEYYLDITTLDGKTYASNLKQLTSETSINQLRVERGFNENDQEGVSIFVESINVSDDPKFYRYQYEETYKIIAPWYSPFELVVLNNDFPYPEELFLEYPNVDALLDFFFELRPREEQEQVCYNTLKSNTILISSTEELIENDSETFRVRFLGRDNPEIRHRYSILVKQYGQSREAYTFYKTLKEFSSSENVFSQVQTGFLEGNVFSTTSQNEKVIGFFEVASYDEQRVYFNFEDLFAGESKPPYFISCDESFTPIFLQEDPTHNIINSPVIEALTSASTQIYFDTTDDESPSPFANRPFELVLRPCGDCTVYGENSAPNFWVEE
jgi:hypothetical protein